MYISKKLLLVSVAGVLAAATLGCTAELTDRALTANAKGNSVAEAHLCKGYMVGVPPLRYADDQDLRDAWMTICKARYDKLLKSRQEQEKQDGSGNTID